LGNPPSEGGTPPEQSFIPTSSFVLALFTTWQPRPSVTTNGMTSTPKEEIRSYLFSRLSLLAILHSCSSKEGSVNTQNISELMLSCQKEINPRTKLQKGGTEKSNLFWLKMLISRVSEKLSYNFYLHRSHSLYLPKLNQFQSKMNSDHKKRGFPSAYTIFCCLFLLSHSAVGFYHGVDHKMVFPTIIWRDS